MLRYTGHPLVDVGAATIAAFARRRDLEHVTSADLDAFADYIAQNYVVDPLKRFLTVAFLNPGYTQHAFANNPERKQDYVNRVARSWREDVPTSNEVCVFTGEPAIGIVLKDKNDIPIGRAFRQHVPMVSGEDVINFHPGGDAGLPISGKALLCIQAFPMGCAKVGGKLLGVHSDNPMITLRFARKFLEENLKQVELARASGESKLPGAKASAKTILIETLVETENQRIVAQEEQKPYSATAYHMSNSGQSDPLDARSPPLEIFELPLEIIRFVSEVMFQASDDWNEIAKRSRKEYKDSQKQKVYRVDFYEDLFALPHGARTFMRAYFWNRVSGKAYWALSEVFARSILNMDEQLLEKIRQIGDRFAQYVDQTGDRSFYGSFFAENRYGHFRDLLMSINRKRLRQQLEPIITLDDFYEAFERQIEDIPRYDRWKLARDLILLRMTDQLYKLGKSAALAEAIPEELNQVESDKGE